MIILIMNIQIYESQKKKKTIQIKNIYKNIHIICIAIKK